MRVLNEEIRASSDAPASFTSIVRERERRKTMSCENRVCSVVGDGKTEIAQK